VYDNCWTCKGTQQKDCPECWGKGTKTIYISTDYERTNREKKLEDTRQNIDSFDEIIAGLQRRVEGLTAFSEKSESDITALKKEMDERNPQHIVDAIAKTKREITGIENDHKRQFDILVEKWENNPRTDEIKEEMNRLAIIIAGRKQKR